MTAVTLCPSCARVIAPESDSLGHCEVCGASLGDAPDVIIALDEEKPISEYYLG